MKNGKTGYRHLKTGKRITFIILSGRTGGHISALKSVLGIKDDDFYKSYIVFSERCTLKKVDSSSPNVRILK
jgi:hypothetical protein